MRKLIFNLVFLLPTIVLAQRMEVVAAGSQELSGAGIHITATIGEVCVSGLKGAKEYATEGFQQGFLSAESTASRDQQGITSAAIMQASLFPNPATDRVQVELQNLGGQSVRLRLYNQLGLLVQEAESSSAVYAFDLKMLASGQYWVAIQPADNQAAIALTFAKINR